MGFLRGLKVEAILLILSLIVLTVLVNYSTLAPSVKGSPTRIYSDSEDGYLSKKLDGSVLTYRDEHFMMVGDIHTNQYRRTFLRFSLSGVSGTVSSSRLKLYLFWSSHDNVRTYGPHSFNPGLGDCWVYHILDYGSLDGTDFSVGSVGNDPGIIIDSTTSPSTGYVSIDITAAIQDDVNNHRAYTAFMIKLSTDTDYDGKWDHWAFKASEEPGVDKDPYIEYNVRVHIPTIATTRLPTGDLFLTDWALSNPTLSPPSPRDGDPVTFGAILQALSTTLPYPQNVKVVASLDGVPISSSILNYLGPTGNPMSVLSTAPWIAQEGTHKIIWAVDPPPYACNDPNRENNQIAITFTVIPKPTFDFSLAATPASQTIRAGEHASFTVTVDLTSGSSSSVRLSLSDLPPAVTHTFAPVQGSPSFSSTLKIITTADTAPGSYPLIIKGSDGGVSRVTKIVLIVQSPIEPDFEISATAVSQTVIPPGSTDYTLYVAGKGAFASTVALTVSGLPSGVQASFTPPSGIPYYTSTLTLTVDQTAPSGVFDLPVYASGGGKTKSTIITLTIKAASASTLTPITTSTESTSAIIPNIPFILEILAQQGYLIAIVILVIIVIALIAALIARGRRG